MIIYLISLKIIWNEEVFRIETFQGKVQTFQTAYSITDEQLMRYPKEASEIAMHSVVNQLAQVIAPYCEYRVEDDPMRMGKRIYARIKLVEPMDKGLRLMP